MTLPDLPRFMFSLLVLAVASLSPSCKSLAPAVSLPNQLSLSEQNLAELAGQYEILSSPATSTQLDEILLFRNYFDLQKKPGEGDRIQIEVRNGTTIRATLLQGSQTVKSKTIKGRFEEGYFRFRHSRLIPFLAVNLYRRLEVRMTRLENGNLRVDDSSTGLAFLLCFPVIGGGDSNEKTIFRKIR